MSKQPVGVFIADVHWMTRKPEYRKETIPFNEVIGRDLAPVAAFCRKHDIAAHVAGDLFERSREFMDMWTAQEFLWREFFAPKSGEPVDMWAVRGQHDLFHHNPQDEATSFNAVLLKEGSRLFVLDNVRRRNVRIYGAGWGDELPVPHDPAADNVLVWHYGLWHKKPIYPGQTEGNVEKEAKRLYELGYKIVFSGDNHRAFDVEVGGVRFYNLGAFTRDDVSLADQQSRFCVLYDDMSVESVYVGEKDVFEIDRSDADKGREDKRDGFSEALAGGFEYGSTFKGSLETIARAGVCGDLTLNDKQKDLLHDIINAI